MNWKKFIFLALMATVPSFADLTEEISEEYDQIEFIESEDVYRFYVSLDFLYWTTQNQGFSYAFDLLTNPLIETVSGRIARLEPEWKPGFRLGLGWYTPHDYWDLFVNYTWYLNHSSETRRAKLAYISLWPTSTLTAPSSSVGFADQVVGGWGKVFASNRLLMNMGDVELGRWFDLTDTISIRPHCGVRGGTIYQKFEVNFTNNLVGTNIIAEEFFGLNNYWGLGPRTGIHTDWAINDAFSILSKISGTLLYGNTKVINETTILQVAATEFIFDHQFFDGFNQLVPNLQLYFGFQWKNNIWCKRMVFKLSAGWEANYWWNQFNLPFNIYSNLVPFPPNGGAPLSLEGVTINLEWDY